MSTPTVTTTTANNVAAIVEQYRYAEAQFHRRRQTLCGPSLTDREALRLIYAKADTDQPCTPRTVATELHITAASTTALLDRLQGASLITRKPNPDDRRSVLLYPVDRRQDPDSIDPLTERIATLAANLTDADATTVATFLSDLAHLVDNECAS